MKPKHNIDEIHSYLKQWYNDECWTDFNMAWDSGYTDLAAYIIYTAGAIDSTSCYEDSRSIEREIERRMKRYNSDLDSKNCFKNAEIYVNPDNNEHAFIRNSDVDYLVTHDDMLSYGYVPSDDFCKYINEYNHDKAIISKLENKIKVF